MEQKTMMINEVEYIRKDSVTSGADTLDGLEYVLIRTYSAGVHIGYLKVRQGKEVTLLQSRRIWYWAGANSLSQLAMEGSKDQLNCKFSCVVGSITLTEAIEIIAVTRQAQKNIAEIKEWKK